MPTVATPLLPPPAGLRFALAWLVPLAIGAAAWRSPWAAFGVAAGIQAGLALAERVPALRHGPAPLPPHPWYAAVLHVHALLQAALLALGVAVATRPEVGAAGVVALGIAVGSTTGAQGITFAHELGHARRRRDRLAAWLLMGSVLYAHFMVEHYRGHHVRAATDADPASARRGESLWRFLPRTLVGSWRSAWALEARQLAQRGRGWLRSRLAWAVAAQLGALVALGTAFGGRAVLFWAVQAAYAVFLLETINYIEHYGLRRAVHDGRPEPFGPGHAWNADHLLTDCVLANLQRHADHHQHAWKPYASLADLPGPRLPTGYAGCLFLATVPPVWRRLMDARLPPSSPR